MSDRSTGGAPGFWDSDELAARVERAYLAPDVVALREAQIDVLAPQAGWSVVDLGCGPGLFAEALAARGCKPALVDFAPSMLTRATARLARAGVEVEAVVEADVASVPLPDGAYDAACCVQVLEYVADPVAVLREAARLVRPGGYLLVADTDWDTMSWNVADVELGRAVARAYASTKPDPWAGRRLGEWVRAAGLEPLRHRAIVLGGTARTGNTFIEHNWSFFRQTIERGGFMSAAELDRFDAEVDAADAAGGFWFGVVRHTWCARVLSSRA